MIETTPGLSKMIEMEVERRSGLSYDEFEREYMLPCRPVILTDSVDECPARRKWTPEYFRERFGDRRLLTVSGEMTMREIVEGVLHPGTGRVPFLRESPIAWWVPELMPDLAPGPCYGRPNWLTYPFARWPDVRRSGYAARLIRIGQIEMNFTGANMRYPTLHVDLFKTHALLVQWYGAKKFFIFPEEDTKYLYRKPGTWVSQITDVEHPDLAKFPDFAKTHMIEFTLQPGEAYFNPTGWWHTTRTLGVSIGTVMSLVNASNWKEVTRNLLMPDAPLRSRLSALPYRAYLRALGAWKLPHYSFPDASDPTWCRESLARYRRTAGSWVGQANGGVPETAKM
ncbi:MAG TPA: cupin-like domain-containing protein [Rhodanobacteraceae bacterium]|nr:cupin-like domain-containing protein [Rhodanobacteraceae bacterium]